jgi:hypothetical protein
MEQTVSDFILAETSQSFTQWRTTGRDADLADGSGVLTANNSQRVRFAGSEIIKVDRLFKVPAGMKRQGAAVCLAFGYRPGESPPMPGR